MSKISQKQMNVPIRTRNNEQVQTDVNLIGIRDNQDPPGQLVHSDARFLNFVNESWMMPFSDYYLLNQLNTVIQQLRNNLGKAEQYLTRRVVDQLAAKIHGLLARQLKVTSKNSGYYQILLQKQKELIRAEVKYGNFEKKMDSSMRRIQELEREIKNLRGSLKIYQSAAEQNQLYKNFFREMKQITQNSKKISDIEKMLNEQVMPKIRQFEINIAEISKNAGRDRSSKQKAAISRYALELDSLNKTKDLDWQTLSNSAAAFYTGLEHLNSDDWIQQRLNLSQAFNQLRTRHTALLSLVSKNVDELLKKDQSFNKFTQITEFMNFLQRENQQGFETTIVNGWIGLGVIHCHKDYEGSVQGTQKYKSLILLFQRQIKRLLDKYPQLNQTISNELRQFLVTEISKQIGREDDLGWIKQIFVRETEVVHVDNVYHYYSKTDKQDLYYSRVLIKALLDELKRINNDHKVGIQLDQGILQLLKTQVLDGIQIDDIIGLFRPAARICQVDVLVDRPIYLPTTQTVGIPLKQEKAVIVADTAHFAVNLQQGVPYRKQIPYEYSKSQVVQVPVTIERPYSVPTKVVEEVIRYDQRINVVKVPVEQQKLIQVVRQVPIESIEQVLVTQQVEREFKVPYHTSQVQTKQIEYEKEVPKNIYKEISKVFKVQQIVPKVYKQPKFEIVQKPVHHIVVQKEIQFVEVQKPIIERLEVAKVTEVLVEKPIYYPEHCDCQKPEAVTVQIQKAVYKQIPKQIIVQKCHFVKGDTQQKIVQVACHTQVPLFKQVIKQEPVFIQKIIPFRTVEQKLVVVDRQIPFFIEHFTPVELIIEKPVIVRDIKHVPVEVEKPVPVFVQKIIPQIVQVFRDRIVQKIVEVPRIEIVQKIVEKIVTIPRIVQRIVTATQLVEVPVFIETPVLQVITVTQQKLATDVKQLQKVVEVRSEVLKIEKSFEVVDKVEYEEVKKVIEVEPETFPEIIVQKIVKVVEQHPVEIFIDRFVDRVIHMKDIIPVEQRVQIPIEVQCPVEIITQVPVYYKQPVVQIDVQRVEREKIVEVAKQTVRVEQIPTPFIQKQKQIVELPGPTIILRQPELHIVQIQKQNVITSKDVEQRPVQHYLDIQKAHVVDQQTFVVPEKQVCYLQKPYPVSIQKPVHLKHQEMIAVERPQTMVVKTREGRSEQVIKVITSEKLVAERQTYREPIPVPEHHYHVLYEQLPPKAYENSVLAIDQKVRTQQVTNTQEVIGANKQIVTTTIQVPVHMERIFQRILMLPQIVQIEKKVYMVQQINSLIAKQVNLETHYDDYKVHMKSIQEAVNQALLLINSGRQVNNAELKKKLNTFLQLLRTESRIPKIVENIREVEVIRQRDRPVLVPVYDSQRQKVLHLIISDLIEGIKGLNKVQLEKRFSERVRNLFSYQLGLEVGVQGLGLTQYIERIDQGVVESRWKSWLDNYGGNLASTHPQEDLTEAQNLFIIGYDSKDIDYATIRASLQKQTLIHKQRLYEIERIKQEYNTQMSTLRIQVSSLKELLETERYYKDLYLNELFKLQKMLVEKKYDKVHSILQTITTIKQQIHVSRTRGTGSRVTFIEEEQIDSQQKVQGRMAQLLSQITIYENQSQAHKRLAQDLRQQNKRLRTQIDDIKLNIPVWNKQSKDQSFKRYNEQWEQRIKGLQQNHFLQLNHLREQLARRVTGDATEGRDQLTRTYDDLMGRYTQLSEAQRTSENQRRNLVNSYEDKLRDATKQLITLKRDQQAQLKKNQSERKRLIEDYQKRLTSTSNNQQKQLRRQLENLRKSFENLENRTEAEKKKLVDEYQRRMASSASNQQKQLRRELDQARRDLQNAQNEKKKLSDDYEAKLKSSSSAQDRQLRRQLDNAKKNNQQLEKKFDDQKKKLVDEYETKIRSSATTQDKQLRREFDNIKRNYQGLQKTSENQKLDLERRIKQLQDDNDKLRSSRRGGSTSPQQSQELQILKDKIKKLQIELDSSKKQVQSYQKSRLGQTTYTSGIKQSILEGQSFQSPQTRYKSSGPKFQQGQQGSYKSKQQQAPEGGRSSEVETKRISKSGVRAERGQRGERGIHQQGQQARSSSSRVSGLSEGSPFKSSMTMREFMDLKKADDKDQIITMVMIKVIQRIQQEADKGIINSYSPNNIYLTNFNSNNIDSLQVKFGAPITNKKSKTDGLYLAPEVLRGQGTNLKSVVFTLAVIWDELIHYEIYYKKVEDIENLAYQYKVRDTSLNPILRNTLFEMMSKDSSKRLDLMEAKRRLSLQRYIVSEGRAGTTGSRVSTQSRRNV